MAGCGGKLAPWGSTVGAGLLLLAVPLVCTSSCERGEQNEAGGKVIAWVGKRAVTEADLDAELRRVRRQGGGAQGIATLTQEGRKKVAEELIDTVTLSAAARRDGVDQRADVKADLANATDRLLARRYLVEVMKGEAISEEELRSYFAGHQGEFRSPEERYVRHIVVRTRQEAQRRLVEIRDGREFAEVAAEANIDGTKMHRGAIGWIRRGVMVAPFEKVAFKLDVGQVSGPVKTEFGWHLIAVEKRRGGDLPPFEKIRSKVRERAENARLEQLLATARSRFPVTFTENLEVWLEKGQNATGGGEDLTPPTPGRDVRQDSM